MDVLAVIHGDRVRAGVFGDVVQERGHRLDEWSLAWETPLPQPLDSYGAVLVFGGAMHADQDDRHPWLREENLFLKRLLMLHMPGMRLLSWAAGLFIAGVALFSGSLYALALGAPSKTGLVTPFGGAAFIAGWIALAIAVITSGSEQ